MSTMTSDRVPGAPTDDVFFGTLRYNIVCEHGHKAWSPDAVGYIGEGFRHCSAQSGSSFTRTGSPRVCNGKLSLL